MHWTLFLIFYMKMKYIVALALFLHLSLSPALAAEVTPENSPAAVVVGQNVTLKPEPNETLKAGNWAFKTNNIVFWYPGKFFIANLYENRVSFNPNDSSLILTSVQVNDSGLYVLNGVEPDFKRVLDLSVQVPVSNVNMTVSETNLVEYNDSVTLNCSASGTPLRFQWINRTSVVTPGRQVQFNDDKSLLTIKNVSRFDKGPFHCNVSNNVSTEESWSVNFNISYGPSNLMMEVAPEQKVYISGSNISLSCSAESKPVATYMWLFNDKALNEYGWQLKLTSLQMKDSGKYTCQVHNSVTSRYAEISKELVIVDPISAVVVNEVDGPPILNKEFILSCNVTGPVDTIYWKRNDTYLHSDDMISLSNRNVTVTFNSVNNSDNGGYQCIAFNAVSNRTSNNVYMLKVNYGPEMPVISAPSIIATGSNLMLHCSAVSWPPSNFTWYFNGRMVTKGPDYKIDSLNLNNSGNYTCSASNDITNITKMVTKEIKVIELITSTTVKVSGDPPVDQKRFMLTCGVEGTVYDRHWMMDGMSLNLSAHMSLSKDNSTLTFDPVLRADDGNYQCVAFNPLSNKTSPKFALLVNYGPKTPVITGPMQPVRAGSQVTLNCSAASEPPSNYIWSFKNLDVGNGSMHTIEEATTSDSGIYTCVAMNDVTKLNSSTTKELIVIDPISAVWVMQVGKPPILDKEFTLSCNVTGPVDAIYWKRNDTDLHSDDRISFSNRNMTVTFSSVTKSDNGGYQCIAFNAVSNRTSNNVYMLKVNYGPVNMTISGQSIVATGSNVTFTCSVSSWPPSSISWSLKGGKVAMGSVYKKESLSPADSGEYTCTAHNNITGLSISANKALTVIDVISKIMVSEADGPPILNMIFNLSCEVTGPADSIYWRKNGTHLHSDDRISFSNGNMTVTFSPVKFSDTGDYQCIAMNAVSNLHSHQYMLLVNYGPWDTVITGPHWSALGSTATFNCSATSWPVSTYTWYFNDTVIEEGPQLVLASLTLMNSGEYTCKAHNYMTGMNSSASTNLQVIVPLTTVTVDTGNQLPIFGKPFPLTCKANSKTTSISWMKDGMNLGWKSNVSFSEGNVTMTIKSVTHSDNGEYQCTAHNYVNEKTSLVYQLKVNFGPDDVKMSGPEHAETGDRATFNCSATSWPPSLFSWYFNGSMVANGSMYTTELLTLGDSGRYICMAYNNVTEMNSTASIHLRVIETINSVVVKPNPVIPMESEDFSLHCDVGGPYNSIQWLKNSQPLVQNSSITISNNSNMVSFKPLKRDNNGLYQCVATNMVKEHFSKPYNLLASYGPNRVIISATAAFPTNLTCSAASQPPSTYEWFIDGKLVGNSSVFILSIYEAAIIDTSISCKAKNPLTNVTVVATFKLPDSGAVPPLQSWFGLTLTVLLALLLSLLGNRIY